MATPARIAETIAAATRDRRELQPFTDDDPDLTLEAAYEAQRLGVQARLDAGERVIGAKLGLTSVAKQRVMNVDAPLHGVVTSGMLSPSSTLR